MKFGTHMIFAALLALFFFDYFKTISVVFILIGAMLPDVDNCKSKISQWLGILSKPVHMVAKHRGMFHTVWFALIFTFIVGLFSKWSIGLFIGIGYLSHIILDAFTYAGISFFHPLKFFRVKGSIPVGGIKEALLFGVLIALTAVKVFFIFI